MTPILIGDYTFYVLIVKPPPEMLSSNDIFTFLYTVEFAALCFAFATIPKFVRILERTPLFHKNLIRITQQERWMRWRSVVHFVYFITPSVVVGHGHGGYLVLLDTSLLTADAYFLFSYAGFFSRIITFLYQINILDVQENSFHAALVVLAAAVRLSFTNFLGLFLPSVVVERMFASRYIADYEKISRSWISTIILLVTTTLSVFFSVTIVMGFYSIGAIAMTTCVLHIAYAFVYVYLFRRDFVKLRHINGGIYQKKVRYTLSTKFQLAENLRVMKILMYLSIVIALSAVIIGFLLYLSGSVYSKQSAEGHMCFELLDVCLAVCYDIIIVIIMVNAGVLRPSRTLSRCCARDGTSLCRVEEHQKLTQIYFDRLNNSWNIAAGHLRK